MSNCKDFRMDIGKQILKMMELNDDLPMPNCYRLAKTMQEYFRQEGMIDLLKEQGYKWLPTIDYWVFHLSDIAEYMRREYKLYFGYLRNKGSLTGQWKFLEKKEWETILYRDHSDIATRVETHNDKIDDTGNRWKVDIPIIQEVPVLISK